MKKLSIRHRLILCTMAAFLLPLGIWLAFTLNQMSNRLYESRLSAAQNSLNQMSLYMTGVINDCRTSIGQLCANADVIRLVRGANTDAGIIDAYNRNVRQLFESLRMQNPAIAQLYVVHDNPTLFDIHNMFVRVDDLDAYSGQLNERGGIYNALNEAQYSSGESGGALLGNAANAQYWFMRGLVQSGLPYQNCGIVELVLYDSVLYAALEEFKASGDETVSLMLQTGEVIWGAPIPIPDSALSASGVWSGAAGATLVSLPIADMNATLVYTIGQSATAPGRHEIGILILLLVCSTLCMLVLTRFIGEAVFSRLAQLSRRMDSISAGFGEPMLPRANRDEIDRVNEHFDQMLKRIEEGNAAEQQLLFDELSNDLQPHFICNAMDMLRIQAENAHQGEIAHSIRLISQYFRYSLMQERKGVTLLSELDDVRNYVDLVNSMREESIGLEVDLDEWSERNAAELILPKMVIQPLVDNAVRHGLKSAKAGLILIRVRREGVDLVLEVEDNGCGMSPEQQNLLYAAMRGEAEWVDERRHVGITNVMMRMDLFYEGQYTLDFVTSAHSGTIFTLTLKGVAHKISQGKI